jgi:K+-sensing histidine kinase KdpD
MRQIQQQAGIKTVVCVTDQRRCDRIIRAGRALADITQTQLAVINVAQTSQKQDPDSIEYLFSVSNENGAEMAVIFEEDSAKAIFHYIKENKVSCVLTGVPGEGDSVVWRIWSRFTHIRFFVGEEDGEVREVAQPMRAARALREAALQE